MVSLTKTDSKIAERYIMHRRQAHTKTHKDQMAQFNGTPAAYFAFFRAEVERNDTWYDRECERIDDDPNATYFQKNEQKLRLADRRLYPAWSGVGPGVDCGEPKPVCQHKECAFLRTYGGDPRKLQPGQFEAELAKLEGEMWLDSPRGVTRSDVEKTTWEQTLHEALISPLDGSVPVRATEGTPAATDAPSEPSPPAPELSAAQLKLLARSCEWCGKVCVTSGGKSVHQRKCEEKPAA